MAFLKKVSALYILLGCGRWQNPDYAWEERVKLVFGGYLLAYEHYAIWLFLDFSSFEESGKS